MKFSKLFKSAALVFLLVECSTIDALLPITLPNPITVAYVLSEVEAAAIIARNLADDLVETSTHIRSLITGPLGL